MRETFTIERLVGGAMKITSDSPWLPGGVMVQYEAFPDFEPPPCSWPER